MYLLFFIPLLLGIFFSAVIAKIMRKRYKNKHSSFYESLEVSTGHYIGSGLQLIGLFYGIPTESIIHPETKQRVSSAEIFDNKKIIKKLKDPKLIQLSKYKFFLKAFLIVYTPIFPIIMLITWILNYP